MAVIAEVPVFAGNVEYALRRLKKLVDWEKPYLMRAAHFQSRSERRRRKQYRAKKRQQATSNFTA